MSRVRDLVKRFDSWSEKPQTGSIAEQRRMAEFANEMRDALVYAGGFTSDRNDGRYEAARYYQENSDTNPWEGEAIREAFYYGTLWENDNR